MEKDNAIIIILLILIVLSAGVYIIVSGTGLTFNHDDKIGQANYTVNNTTAKINNTNDTTADTTRDTGIYAPSSDSGYSDSGSYYYSSATIPKLKLVSHLHLKHLLQILADRNLVQQTLEAVNLKQLTLNSFNF